MADSPDLSQLDTLTATQKAGGQNLLSGQSADDLAYLKQYTDFLNSQEGQSAMAKRIGGELGIPALQANATMLQNTLTNLPSTYSKAMTGYDVNQNQLARTIGQKSSELQPMVTTAENSLNAANTNLNNQMGYATADQAKAALPYATEKELMLDRQARETTLYSQDNQNELNALISKLQMGVTLSEGEKNRAQELSIQENNYNNAKEAAKTAAQTAGPNTQIVTVNGKQVLINSQTGQVISTYGSATTPKVTWG